MIRPDRIEVQADGGLLQKAAQPDAAGEALLSKTAGRMKLSACG
jgi:hypothetical protein